MSRARCNRAAIRKDLFSPQNLADEESIRCTLQEFQATLKPDNLDTVIEAVISLQSGQILALIITCIQKDCILLPWLLDMFPTTIDSFSSSLHNSILFYLASYMPEIEEASLPTSEQHKLVINFSAILGCLSKISFQDDTSRKKSRKGRKAVELSDHEIVLLRSMGISVPNSPSQRDAIHRKLLSQAKDVMQNYIACLRSGRAEKEVLGSFLNTGGLAHDSGGYDNVSLNHHLSAHFAAVQGFGQWRLLVSTQAEQDLRTMFQKESKSFQEVMEKLKQLSHGFFSEHDRRVLYGANISVPIYQVRVLHYWVIFQVDCMVDSERQSVIQALKIYGCYTYDKLQHEGFCKAVEYHLRQKGKVYEARCKARKVASSFGNEVSRYVPITFTILETPSECDEEATVDPLPPDDVNQLELLKVFSRIYPFSQGLMHALKDDLPVRLLLQLSPKEQEIVRHPYSVYVIGRSGTGKTLVMLQKMLLIEKASKELSAEYRRPRQVFVTKSRLLALQVAAEFHQSAVALGIYSSSERTDAHQDEFSSMIDYNDETFDHYASTLTSGFDGLEDKDFPLFTSFADLCSLVLEAAKTHRKYAEKYKAFKKKPLISAIDFHHKYWPRFSDNLKRGLSPTTVFSEILGVIKGCKISFDGRSTTSPVLAQSEYEKLSSRAYPTFAGDRTRIYMIFEQYKALKQEWSEFDTADRTYFLLTLLQDVGLSGQKIDYLYVDEVQDNLLLDILLLRSLCANPDGMFWAGDTAQSISPGSSFRFNDLKRLLYEVERKRLTSGWSQMNQPHEPTLFHLATNYRSHMGIGRCATAVVNLISRFWPNTIDSVPSEDGLPGPKPLVLLACDVDMSAFDQCQYYKNGQLTHFDQVQCILVRDHKRKQVLTQLLLDSTISILTIHECKGMEFENLMIYNFFEDSPANLGQWRLVTQDGLNNFDPIKHAILCTELKILYVAITRARHTVQIVDESPKGYPMQEYWSSRDLIAVGVPGPKSVRRQSNQLGATRINYGQLDGKELVRRGQEFFNRGLYEDAEQCFIRAGKQSKAQIARAYVLKSIADHSSDRGRGLQIQFLKAGDAFEALAKAGIGQSQEYWRVAGVCFYKAGNFEKAVCIWYYGRLFDQALACIMENASQISMEITEQVLKEARRVYFSNGDFRKALKTFPNPSADRALEWLDLQDWIDTKIQLLVHLGRFSAAAIIHKTGGRSYEAIALWMKEYKECPNSARQAAAEITLYIRQLYGFKNWAKVDTTIAHQLLEWIGELESSRLNLLKGSTEILSIFKRHMASASENADQTQFLSQIHTRDQICFLLAMSHYCKSIPSWEHSIDWQTLVQRLHIFLEYLTELSQLAHGSLESAAKVFGFILESSGAIHIPRGTFLFDAMQPLPKNGMLQSRDDFRERLVNVISNYIVELAIAQDAWCRKVPLLQIQNCIYTMSTDFTSSACSLHSEHLDSGGIYRWKAYAYQLGIANMMNSQTNRNVEVYQTEENPITMYWFKRLACAFNPILGCHTPHLPLGGMQARKVQEYHRFVNEVGPPSFTIDGKKHAFGHALYSYLKRAANQSLWAMRSIWTAHSTVEGYTLWTPSRVELFSSYIERLTMALVIRYRCGDLEDLELPDLWITEEIWDFAERNSTDTGEELIDEALVEALELTCRMIIRASEYIDAVETSVMARLYAVVYILATETGLWSIVRYTLLGETAPLSRTRFEDDYSAMRLVQSRFEPFIYIVKVGSSWVEHLESLSASTDPKLESDADGSPTYDDSLTHDDHHDSESDDSFGDGQWQ